MGIRLPALPEEAGGTLALGTVSIGASSRDSRIAAALYFAWFIMAVVRAIYIPVVFLQSGCLQHFRFVALEDEYQTTLRMTVESARDQTLIGVMGFTLVK